MKIKQFEEIQAWQLARELTKKVYNLTKKPKFSNDYGLKKQIRAAAGSVMHNIAEGFDSESNAEFIRFLRYAKRSCTEVQSELYVALDEKYVSANDPAVAGLRASRKNACCYKRFYQLPQKNMKIVKFITLNLEL